MDPARWEQMQALFHRAADLSEPDRAAFLDQSCGEDPEMRAAILAMLDEDARSATLVDRDVTRVAQDVLGETASLKEVGPYRIQKLLGEGGMGIVYLAERSDLGNLVAIKFLRDAWLSPARRQRFASEQRTLAQLNHPGIARLYDADTLPDGTPWFAMEYVDGMPLSEYCRANHCGVKERLLLVRAVAEAVEYAHQSGVIHRDLKPSNILVRRDGAVRLLDFGIARQIDPTGVPVDQTRTAFRPLTPAYAAPEQLRGEPVGVQTDVYALGVILYELLSGRLPFDVAQKTPTEAAAMITTLEPARPSTEGRRTGTNESWNDLDVMCLTAMDKDPQRRYRSVAALIRDIDHYLKHDPLEARPDSVAYTLGKFLRRNQRAAAALGLLVAIAVSIGVLARRQTSPAAPNSINIAILPFQNASGNGALDFLRAALPDEIANALATARSVTLRPTAASARFSQAGVDFRQAGHDLDANRIITGHFLIMGDRLHVTMEAVDPDQDRIVWHDSLDVPSNNLLRLQEQIAAMSHSGLARALGVPGFVTELAPRASNEEAYELYLKSDAFVFMDSAPNQQAIELLRRAVLLDPNYAPAWDSLAVRYYQLARFGGGGPQMMALSDAAAEKELALNPDSMGSLTELTVHRTERGDLVRAHQIALELVRRRPDDPNLHHVLSYVLRYGGSLEEAGRECDLVALLASKMTFGSCSTTFMELGNYKRAWNFLFVRSEWSKAHAIEMLLREGRKDEAIRTPLPQIPNWKSYRMLLAAARRAPASEIQALASKVEVDDDPEVDYFFAAQLAYSGQNADALRFLKIAIDRNYCSWPAMDKDPFFDGLRTNAAFQQLRQAGIACHTDFANDRQRRIAVQ